MAKNTTTTAMPELYKDGHIEMSPNMITTKEAFVKIWAGRMKGRDVNEAAKRALAWKKKVERK